ncbi:flagellar hook-basal body complex protein FliE [Thermocrinis minervae]|uniref:Flagellar hook-basal body complex protein FliE n=1 Tax=Thermocrinis minervae TaxID=381751 RepID=A0A1M6SKZ4_9AQUI|nr:flagellar hook-basal body complex protein FliE [Thermocrinis minervae]SHK45248.1 flagellar hook-basal body complex protein FliE [Thermocrinis minervae]
MEIKPLNGFSPVYDKQKTNDGGPLESFKDFLLWVDAQQKKAESIKEAVLKGEDVPLHTMVLEFEKANVALQLLIQVRNKLLDAFQELSRMQI